MESSTFGNVNNTNMSGHINITTTENGSYLNQTFIKRDDISATATLVIYSVIFVLAVVGNILVILTLIQNTRMRTVTNVFLLNLAVSDLLLAVFCMPFTLIPMQVENFIFGPFMCVAIRYAQGKFLFIVYE